MNALKIQLALTVDVEAMLTQSCGFGGKGFFGLICDPTKEQFMEALEAAAPELGGQYRQAHSLITAINDLYREAEQEARAEVGDPAATMASNTPLMRAWKAHIATKQYEIDRLKGEYEVLCARVGAYSALACASA